MPDFAIDSSRAVTPTFYRAPYPEGKWVPYEYQLAGVEYCLARPHALIGDAPGLGKTPESILISNAIDAERTLVVCPASLRLNWEREIWRWSTIPNVSVYPVEKSRDGISPDADYTVISYDLLRNPAILDAILDLRWDHLVLDEAHALKDPKGNKRTKAICAPDMLPSVVGRITMASGTILPNQPIECYNAVRLLNWDAIDGASLEDFREAYYRRGEGFVRKRVCVDEDNDVWAWKLVWSNDVMNVPCNLADLQQRLRRNIMVRRLKEQVLHELPSVQLHPFPLSTTPEMRKVLSHPGWQAAEKLYDMDAGAFDISIPVDGAVSTARRLMGVAKAGAVAAYIDDLIESGVSKVVVAAWHEEVMDILFDKLRHHGLVRMVSSMSGRARQNVVDHFQEREEIKIILGQTQIMGEGWTLTKAQDVVVAEPDWVPGKNQQLVDRIHRIGQSGDYCMAHVPIVPGTMDERILGKAIQKDVHIHQALDQHH